MPLIVDAHSDLLNLIHHHRTLGREKVLEEDWVPGMREAGIGLRVAALYSEPDLLPELALRRALDLTADLLAEVQESPSAELVTSAGEMDRVLAQGRIGFILGMEGAEPLGTDLRLLRIFYRLGLRVLGLTHAPRNQVADGAPFFPAKRGREGGLSAFGVSLVEAAQEMGILIDLSHLNKAGFWDVLEISSAPLIASHSNCRVLHDFPRNLTDRQIRVLADQGGVIGINAASLLVEPPTLERLLDNLDHLVKVGGIEAVGLGPDFCDYLIPLMSPTSRALIPVQGGRPVEGLAGDRDLPKIAAELDKRGYPAGEIELILGLNFLRVFKEVF